MFMGVFLSFIKGAMQKKLKIPSYIELSLHTPAY